MNEGTEEVGNEMKDWRKKKKWIKSLRMNGNEWEMGINEK